ncbi:LLM class flavin-dependent oxidoreductase [soil metagenome]
MALPFSQIPVSVLDLAPVIAGGSIGETLRRTVDLAQKAEGWGYRRFWLAEHHNMPGIASAATSLVIGHVAGQTKTLRVGSGGVMLLNHAPLVIAEQFGTLEALYPGRIDLGLGRAPGTDQATMRILRRNLDGTGDDFPERLEELRAFFRVPVPGQRIRAVPGAGLNVPIWLLGSGGFSAQLAGQLGLPFGSAGHFSPDNMLAGLDLYRRSFRSSESLAKSYALVCVNVFAAETDEAAARLATSHFQAHLELARGNPVTLPPPLASPDILAEPTARHFLQGSIIGSPATVKAGLAALAEETQADELMIHSMIYDHEARLRSYEILSEIQRS